MLGKISVLIFLMLIIISPAKAFAETESTAAVSPTGSSKTPVKDAMMELKEAAKEKMMAAKEDYKAKIASIKDAKKKALVEKIDSNISEINERRTSRFTEQLTKLSGVVDRIATRAETLKTEGKDTAKLMTAIVNAKSAISAAQTKINEQKVKTYSANITTDQLLKSVIGSLVTQFRTDLKSVFTAVKAAKDAVGTAMLEEKALSMTKSDKTTATPSAAVSTTPTE